MLLLMRHYNESITINTPDGDITVKVVELGPSRVTLGVQAPKRFAIHRDDAKRKFT